MGSSGKKRTTMAKLNRESKLRERRIEKDARKAARKQAGADHGHRDEVAVEPPSPTTVADHSGQRDPATSRASAASAAGHTIDVATPD